MKPLLDHYWITLTVGLAISQVINIGVFMFIVSYVFIVIGNEP